MVACVLINRCAFSSCNFYHYVIYLKISAVACSHGNAYQFLKIQHTLTVLADILTQNDAKKQRHQPAF